MNADIEGKGPEFLAVCSPVKVSKRLSFIGSELSVPAPWKAEIGFDVFSICVDLSNLRLIPTLNSPKPIQTTPLGFQTREQRCFPPAPKNSVLRPSSNLNH